MGYTYNVLYLSGYRTTIGLSDSYQTILTLSIRLTLTLTAEPQMTHNGPDPERPTTPHKLFQ